MWNLRSPQWPNTLNVTKNISCPSLFVVTSKGVSWSAIPNNLGIGFACIGNGFHKAGVVVDSPQAIVTLKRIVDSFAFYDVSLSIEGIDEIHSNV